MAGNGPKKSKPPIYGIDNNITFFDDSINAWNLNRLTNVNSIIHELKLDLPRLLKPSVDVGMRYTAFGWQVENSYLASVDILHEGGSKFWYSVPNSSGKMLEDFCKKAAIGYECHFLLRHKLFLIPPSVLNMNGIKFGKVILNSVLKIFILAHSAIRNSPFLFY